MKPVYRNLIFLCLFLIMVATAWHFGNMQHYISLQTIKDNQQFLLSHIHDKPLLAGVIYIGTFFTLTLSALPVTLIMIVIGGFLFGTVMATLYAQCVLLASSICIFKLSKKMFGRYTQEKYSYQLKKFNDNFNTYGFYYLILLRTMPVIPFFMVNLAAGFTHIDTKKFIAATVIGTIPMVLICSYLGSQCASLVVNW